MIGQLASSKAGHDKERLYVIVAQERDMVYLCDGVLRPPDKPKKKRMKHIQLINYFVEENLCSRLLSGRKVYGEEIRYALKQYLNQQDHCYKKHLPGIGARRADAEPE